MDSTSYTTTVPTYFYVQFQSRINGLITFGITSDLETSKLSFDWDNGFAILFPSHESALYVHMFLREILKSAGIDEKKEIVFTNRACIVIGLPPMQTSDKDCARMIIKNAKDFHTLMKHQTLDIFEIHPTIDVVLDGTIYHVTELVWAYTLAYIMCPHKERDALETSMSQAGIYNPFLPTEVNQNIGYYLYHGTSNDYNISSIQYDIQPHHLVNLFNMAESIQKSNLPLFNSQLNHMSRSACNTREPLMIQHQIEHCREIAQKFFCDHNGSSSFDTAQLSPGIKIFLRNRSFVEFILRQGYTSNFRHISPELQDDLEIAKIAIRDEPLMLLYASDRLKDNTDLVRIAISKNSISMKYASERLKSDASFILDGIQNDYEIIAYASANLLSNKQFIMAAIKADALCIDFMMNHEEFADDNEVIMAAVRCHHHAFEFASERLQRDRDFIKLLIKENFEILYHLNPELQNDEEIIFAGLSGDVIHSQMLHSFGRYSNRLWNNRNFVEKAVQLNGLILEWCSTELRDDENIVMKALTNNVNSLKGASSRLCDDEDIVRFALFSTEFVEAFYYASKRLRSNKDLVLDVIKKDGSQLNYASAALQDDEDVVLLAITGRGSHLSFASSRIKNMEKFAKIAVADDGYNLKYVSSRLQDDKELVSTAVAINGCGLRYASARMQKDADIVLLASKQRGQVACRG